MRYRPDNKEMGQDRTNRDMVDALKPIMAKIGEKMDKLDSIRNLGIKAQGRTELISYLKGGKLTMRQSVKAYCYSCMGYYADVRSDCQMLECPLYPFNPAGSVKQKTRAMTDEQKALQGRRLRQNRGQGKGDTGKGTTHRSEA